jgi:ribosomal protein L20A (L18A)
MEKVVMKVFRVKGSMPLKNRQQAFSVDVLASSQAEARRKALTQMGSRHGVKSYLLKVDEVKEIKPEESKSQFIVSMFEK